MRKRVLLGLLLIIGITVSVFAGGVFETTNIINKEGDNEISRIACAIKLYEQTGYVEALVAFKDATYRSRINHIVVKSGEGYYDGVTGNYIVTMTGAEIFLEMETEKTGTFEITAAEENGNYPSINNAYKCGNINLNETAAAMQEYKNQVIRIPLEYKTGANEIELLIIKENNQYEYFKSEIYLEFFKGERDFFDTAIELDDGATITDNDEKMFYFMKSVFEEAGQLTEYISASKTTFGIVWVDARSNKKLVFAQNANKTELYTNFKRALRKHLLIKYETRKFLNSKVENIPYLDISAETAFNAIYSGKYNKYLKTYMALLFQLKKPVVSGIMQEALNTANKTIKKGALYYNYKNYQEITADEGKSIADNALKYLAWGVEYTPYSAPNTLNVGIANKPVFNLTTTINNEEKRIVDFWTENAVANLGRQENYAIKTFSAAGLGSDSFSNQAPGQIQILTGDYNTSSFKLIGRINSKNSMKISKIDIWTSENLAWQDGVVKEIQVNGKKSADMAANTIKDKNLPVDTGATRQNLHITNKSGTDKTKEVGYQFYSKQTVGGLLLVQGAVPAAEPRANKGEYVRIKYKAEDGNYYYASEEEKMIEIADDGVLFNSKQNIPEANKLNDQKPATYWLSNKNEKTYIIEFDLGMNFVVNRIRINWGKDVSFDGWAKKYKIEIAKDAGQNRKSAYTLIFNEEDGDKNINNTGIAAIDISKQRFCGRYLKLTLIEKGKGRNCFLLRDFAVYKSDIFEEYVNMPGDNKLQCYADPADLNTYPGYGLYKHPGITDADLAYNYYIFKQPVSCTEIILEDLTGNSFLNVAELMVFPENPIDYKNKDAKGNIEPGKPGAIIIEKNEDGTDRYIASHTTIADPGFLLINANPGKYIKLTGDKESNGKYLNALTIDLKEITRIKTIAVYEPLANPGVNSTIYCEPLILQYGINYPEESIFFDNSEETALLKNFFQDNITTPFAEATGKPRLGNPLAYTPGGIDSPRTFNYKMLQQVLARQWYLNRQTNRFTTENDTTRAINQKNEEEYKAGYLSEIDLFKESQGITLELNEKGVYKGNYPDNKNEAGIKPFLPGYYTNNTQGYIALPDKSIYNMDKVAGVDSLGMLMGCIAVSNIEGLQTRGIVNLFNKDLGDELDKYYAMKPGAAIAGLDEKTGKPVFYADSNNTILAGEYRFSKSDLEKNSIIVPDILMIRKGDLIVRYNDSEDTHIGIVVGDLWIRRDGIPEPMTISEAMNKVLVVSVDRKLRMVTLGTWGNGAGSYNGFTTEPERYHIRRLVKASQEENAGAKPDDWEVVKNYVGKMTCQVTLPLDPYTNSPDHWIPNTDELFGGMSDKPLGGISIVLKADIAKVQNVAGYTLDLSEAYNIKILAPEDQFFDKTAEQGGQNDANIQNNKGTGLEFYAIDDTEKNSDQSYKTYLLATFTRRDPKTDTSIKWADLTGKNNYTVTYNSFYFNEAGAAKTNYELKVKDDGTLYFRITTGEQEVHTSSTFGVKAFGHIRPGDDFLLRFGLIEQSDITADAIAGDFMALYDKKMLWRANLYIDERINEDGTLSGNVDWNDVHPWINGNDWVQANSNVPGGQIKINPWTRPYDGTAGSYFTNFSTAVHDAVAYTHAGSDSPMEFNQEMEAQLLALKQYYNNNYSSTLAPDNKWENYIDYEKTYNGQTVNTVNYKPYRPTYTSITLNNAHYFIKDFNDYNSNQVSKASGVDCSTYLQRIASYNGEPYKMKNIVWSSSDNTQGEERLVWGNYKEEIIGSVKVCYDESWPIYSDVNINSKNNIIPGDIICMKDHVVIINRVIFKDNQSRIINLEESATIEAMTSTESEYKVINSRTIVFFFDKDNLFQGIDKHKINRIQEVKRLKIK